MSRRNKSIETLITEARLEDAQQHFKEFLDLCEEKKDDLVQTQARTAFLQKQYSAGVLDKEGDIEHNRITLSFLTEMRDFRTKLRDYFDVGDSKQLFQEHTNRDTFLLKALESRVTDRQYLISSQLKDGNSSVIFQLKKAHTGQDAVALVLKLPELAPSTKNEFIKIMELRHRNVIKMLDHSLELFPFFVVTEYVHGETIAKAIAQTGPRSISQAVDWIYQLAEVLDYIRHKGILHTNVRPSKIFIDEELNVMISPFDFNKTNRDERTFTRFQDVCLYGSPELLACDGGVLSLSEMCISDQYSLGLIVYKILTGNDLFEGNSILEIVHSRQLFQNNKAYRAAKLAAFPAGKLGQILKKLLSEDPSKRYANLHEVVVALHSFTHQSKETSSTNSIRNSYRRCLGKNRLLIQDFYDQLFINLPDVKSHFQTPKRQLTMLQLAIDLLIDLDLQPTLFHSLITNDKHRGYTVETFNIFIDTFIDTIHKNDPQWDSVKSDWLAAKEKYSKAIEIAKMSIQEN